MLKMTHVIKTLQLHNRQEQRSEDPKATEILAMNHRSLKRWMLAPPLPRPLLEGNRIHVLGRRCHLRQALAIYPSHYHRSMHRKYGFFCIAPSNSNETALVLGNVFPRTPGGPRNRLGGASSTASHSGAHCAHH